MEYYKIDVQKRDTNELVQSIEFNAESVEQALKDYHTFCQTEDKGTYCTLSDSNDVAIATSNEAIGKYINIPEIPYKVAPFNLGKFEEKETPSIYIAIDGVPLAEGVNRLAEKMSECAEVCIIATSQQKDIKPCFDYLRENMPSVKPENIIFMGDGTKDKTNFVKHHHHYQKVGMNGYQQITTDTPSHAEISMLLSSSEKDLKDWEAKGGTAMQLVDESHPQTYGSYVNVSIEGKSEERKGQSINGCCIGVLHDYDNLILKTLNEKGFDAVLHQAVADKDNYMREYIRDDVTKKEGQFVPKGLYDEYDGYDVEFEQDLGNGYDVEFEEDLSDDGYDMEF
jgi:hypothetical protein